CRSALARACGPGCFDARSGDVDALKLVHPVSDCLRRVLVDLARINHEMWLGRHLLGLPQRYGRFERRDYGRSRSLLNEPGERPIVYMPQAGLKCDAASGGANLNAATQGVVAFHILSSTLL